MFVNKELFYRQIGTKIAYFRKIVGYSQEELAEKIDVHRTVIARIESGTYNDNVSLGIILDIAEALKIEPYCLLQFSELEKELWNRNF